MALTTRTDDSSDATGTSHRKELHCAYPSLTEWDARYYATSNRANKGICSLTVVGKILNF